MKNLLKKTKNKCVYLRCSWREGSAWQFLTSLFPFYSALRNKTSFQMMYPPFYSRYPMRPPNPHTIKASKFDRQDEAGYSAIFYDEKEMQAGMQFAYPSSATWTEEQKSSRAQSMYLLHACGLPLGMLQDKPDPPEWDRKYKELNPISACERAKHVRELLIVMTRQLLIAPLMNRCPSIESELQIKDSRNRIEQLLANSLGSALFGPVVEENIPMVALPKILEVANRWDRNRVNLDIGPEEFGLFTIETVLPRPIKAPNGYWLVPLKSYADIKNEGDDLEHCVWGHRLACMFDGLNIIGVRASPDKPEYTAGIQPNRKGDAFLEYSPPKGSDNIPANEEASEAWNWFMHELDTGRFGNQKRLIEFSRNKAEMRESLIDVLKVITGYDPRGQSGMETSRNVWTSWAKSMDNLLRYRKLSLDDMLEKSGIAATFDFISQDAGATRSQNKRQLTLGF